VGGVRSGRSRWESVGVGVHQSESRDAAPVTLMPAAKCARSSAVIIDVDRELSGRAICPTSRSRRFWPRNLFRRRSVPPPSQTEQLDSEGVDVSALLVGSSSRCRTQACRIAVDLKSHNCRAWGRTGGARSMPSACITPISVGNERCLDLASISR
jgi:hypothetical protein